MVVKKVKISYYHQFCVTMVKKRLHSPRFSEDALMSVTRGHRPDRPLPLGGFALPGECSDWLLWRRIVGSRATNEALCLKLDDARLISEI